MRASAQTGRHPVTASARGIALGYCAIRAAVAVLLACLVALPGTAAAAEGLAGQWRLNEALTREVQPENKGSTSTSSGFPQPMIVVGGMPVPVPGTSAPRTGLGGASPDPMVMRCAELTVTPAGDELALEFPGVGSDRLRRGDNQGVVSRWNERKLTTHYRTTTRKVSQTWEIRQDGRLLVTIKLNPDHGKTQTHKRVFDRVPP